MITLTKLYDSKIVINRDNIVKISERPFGCDVFCEIADDWSTISVKETFNTIQSKVNLGFLYAVAHNGTRMLIKKSTILNIEDDCIITYVFRGDIVTSEISDWRSCFMIPKHRHKDIRSAIAILRSVFPVTLAPISKTLVNALLYNDISMLIEAKRQLRILEASGTELVVVNGVLTLLST